MTSISLDQVADLAAQLPPTDRLRLVERIAHELAREPNGANVSPQARWADIRGIVTYPYVGQDAQEWVSQGRHEADEQRAKQRKGAP